MSDKTIEFPGPNRGRDPQLEEDLLKEAQDFGMIESLQRETVSVLKVVETLKKNPDQAKFVIAELKDVCAKLEKLQYPESLIGALLDVTEWIDIYTTSIIKAIEQM